MWTDQVFFHKNSTSSSLYALYACVMHRTWTSSKLWFGFATMKKFLALCWSDGLQCLVFRSERVAKNTSVKAQLHCNFNTPGGGVHRSWRVCVCVCVCVNVRVEALPRRPKWMREEKTCCRWSLSPLSSSAHVFLHPLAYIRSFFFFFKSVLVFCHKDPFFLFLLCLYFFIPCPLFQMSFSQM